jgi:hypothetical protein
MRRSVPLKRKLEIAEMAVLNLASVLHLTYDHAARHANLFCETHNRFRIEGKVKHFLVKIRCQEPNRQMRGDQEPKTGQVQYARIFGPASLCAPFAKFMPH